MSRTRQIRWIGVAVLWCLAVSAQAWVSVFPKGITVLDASQVSPGIVVFNANTGLSYAVSTGGQLVRTWASPDSERPLMGFTEPLVGGTVLAYVSDGPKPGCAVNCGDKIVEMDDMGNVVWEYVDTEGRFLHHDFERLASGNTMILCSKELNVPEISDKPIIDDCVIEVDPAGNVVWEWQTADHYDEIGLSDEAKALIFEAGGDWGHSNGAGVIPENTSVPDNRFRPGNVFLQFQSANLLIVVDRDTDEIVWSLKDVVISPHGTNFLADDVTGGGHFLTFDNGAAAGYPTVSRIFSRVVEIDPTDDSIPYEYTATSSGATQAWSLYSHFKGNAQRLPDGNTMIVEGSSGRIFEVTDTGEIVWELVSPLDTGGNDIYRAFKVPFSWIP